MKKGIRVKEREDIVEVYNKKKELLLKIRFTPWNLQTTFRTGVCMICKMSSVCRKPIFGLDPHSNKDHSFLRVICNNTSSEVFPNVSKNEGEMLYRGIKGKVIKKNLRK